MNIKDLLKLRTHEEVTQVLLENTDESYFVYKSTKFTLIIPNGVDFDNPAPMLCVHTDTVAPNPPESIEDSNNILTNPNGVLGADDRAGCWIVNELLKAKESRFIIGIFDEEEIGGIGSSELMKSTYFTTKCITEDSSIVSCFIGLDRRGGDEVAYYGMESNEFVSSINTVFPELREVTGSFTDASNLAYEYQISCCNLSVGYYNEHTAHESLKVLEMERILKILQEADTTLLSSRVYDVDYVETPQSYWWDGKKDYDFKAPAVDKYKVIKCDMCGLPDTLYEGNFNLHLCEYCLEEMEEDAEDVDGWL